jgi:hexosaminidase
LNSSNLVKI